MDRIISSYCLDIIDSASVEFTWKIFIKSRYVIDLLN